MDFRHLLSNSLDYFMAEYNQSDTDSEHTIEQDINWRWGILINVHVLKVYVLGGLVSLIQTEYILIMAVNGATAFDTSFAPCAKLQRRIKC